MSKLAQPNANETWTRLLSYQRYGVDEILKIEDEVGRSQFQKDIDRIIFSRPFRRLAKKTQVHPMARNDHMHNRLTHTIEVANVGKVLGMRLGAKLKENYMLPEDLHPHHLGEIVQAACYAHDIGNTPFGHAGEEAIKEYLDKDMRLRLNEIMQQASVPEKNISTIFKSLEKIKNLNPSFEGNAQGFRIITKLQHNYRKGGLRLTYATLGAFLKYPWTSENIDKNNKFNVFETEKDILEDIANRIEMKPKSKASSYCRHPLVYLVEAADDLCNRIMDLEDGVEAKIISYKKFEDIFMPFIDKRAKSYREVSKSSDKAKMGYIRAKSIGKAIFEIVETFMCNHDEILCGKGVEVYDEHRKTGMEKEYAEKDILFNSPKIASVFRVADQEVKNLYKERRKVELEAGSFFVLETILNACLSAFREWMDFEGGMSKRAHSIFEIMGNERPEDRHDITEGFRRCIDFVAGMTDEYATYLSKQIRGAGQ